MKLRHLLPALIVFCNSNASAQMYDLELLEIVPPSYVTPGTYDFRISVGNAGTSTVTSLRYNYQVDNGPIVSAVVTDFEVYNTQNIFANTKTRFQCGVPITFTAPGVHTIKAWCDQLNGYITDQDNLNDTLTETVKVLSYVPPKHTMIDYYTHTMCGPCGSQGDGWMDQMLSMYPNEAHKLGIHHASTDPFTTTQSTQLDWDMNVSAHPTFYFDRFKFPFFADLETGTGYIYFTPWKPVRDRLEYTEAIDVNILNVQFDPVSRLLEFDVQATFYDDYVADLALNAYLVEDSLFYYQAGAPNPNNYYHRYVFRESLGPVFGIPGSLPPVMPNGTAYTQSFSKVIPVTQDIDQMYIYGLVQSPGTTYLTRPVLNMRSARVINSLTGMNNVAVAAHFNLNPSLASEEITIDVTCEDLFTLKIVGADGKAVSIYQSYPNQKTFEVDVRKYASGIYSVVLQSKNSNFHTKFIKVK